jgi:hypothetical protein
MNARKQLVNGEEAQVQVLGDGVYLDSNGTLLIDADAICEALGVEDDLSDDDWADIVAQVLREDVEPVPGSPVRVTIEKELTKEVYDYGN